MDKSHQDSLNRCLLEFQKANYLEAIKGLKKLEIAETHFLIHWYLSHSYFKIHDYKKALEQVKISIKLKSEDEINLNFLGEIYHQIYSYNESIDTFKKVLEKNKKNIHALSNLAKINSELGNFEIAKDYYLEIIKHYPDNIGAWHELIKIDKSYLNQDLVNKIENNYSNEKNKINQVYSNYILAQYSNSKKNIEKEFEYLIEAKKQYHSLKIKAFKQETNYYFNLLPKFIKKYSDIDYLSKKNIGPIFIMGLPRSGTTLIENLISSGCPDMDFAEESEVFSKIFFKRKIIQDYNNDELLDNFNKIGFEKLKFDILEQYSEIGINPNKVFTDKSLENFLYIELIYKIFPDAKFIYCKRDKLANFIGILKVFLPNLLWSNSINSLVKMIELHHEKLNKIINEKKINIKIISLESLSSNPKKYGKEIYDFLNLEWHEKFLNENSNHKRVIKTLSSSQAREKIKEHNLDYLEPYKDLLEKYKIDLI